MRKYLLTLLSFSMLFAFFSSCKKDFSSPPIEKPDNSAIFPTTQKEKERVETIKEVGSILKEIYKNLWVTYEVNVAIKTGYYEDEKVLLRDLLTPEKSPVYQTQKFLSSGARKGVFKSAFAEQLTKGNYPHLIAAIGQPPSVNSRTMEGWPVIDPTNEIWTNEYGLSIYFPYSEDYILSSPFDVTVNTVDGQLVTIVNADREADSGPGSEPYLCAADPNLPMGFDNLTICYNSVTVDDDYADGVHPVHIVGVGGEQRILPANPPPATNVVFIGEVKCDKKNYDHFITFNGYLQGGGPDLRFCRGSGYLTQDGNGQITNPQNVVQANPTRKQCKNETWIPVYSVWDADWVPDNFNQVFAIYEEDKQGTATVNLSLATTVTISPGTGGGFGITGTRTVGFSWSFKTEDDIIRQLAWSRQSFFQYNQGGLNNNCGTRNSWTIYDCFSHVSYTMPTQ